MESFARRIQAFEKSFQALEKLEQILIKLFSKKFKSKRVLGASAPRAIFPEALTLPISYDTILSVFKPC